MTSKLVVNTIEADTGISSVSFASSISLSSTSKFFFGAAGIDIGADTNINRPAAGVLGFNINDSQKVVITSNGRLGIGTNNPTQLIEVQDRSTGTLCGLNVGTQYGNAHFGGYNNYPAIMNSGNQPLIYCDTNNDRTVLFGDTVGFGTTCAFRVNGAERARIDSSGRLLIGSTSSANTNNYLEVHTTYGGRMGFARNDTSTAAGNNLGTLSFYGNDSNGTFQESAKIEANADLDHATGDKPGRLVFYTTPDGATTPAERLRIDSNGDATFAGIIDQGTPGGDIRHVVKSFGPGFLGHNSFADLTLDAGQGGGTVTVHSFRVSDNNLSKTSIFGFQLRGTGTASLGSEIYGQTGSSGNASFTVAAIAQGIKFTNEAGATVKYSVTFDLTGDL